MVSLSSSGVMGRSIEGIGSSSSSGMDSSSLSASSSSSSLSVAGITSSARDALGEGKLGLDRGTRISDSFRFRGFDEDPAAAVTGEVSIALARLKFRGVDSSSGLKSSSSSSNPGLSYRLFCAVPKILGSLALLLKFPKFSADPVCAGVPLSISNAILLGAT